MADKVQVEVSPFSDIQHVRKRAFLEAYARCGTVVGATEAAGISQATPYTRQWLDDAEFQEAYRRAQRMAAEGLADEARRRATEGVRSYQFTKSGEVIRHPEECECGCARRRHVRDKAGEYGACRDCTCQAFVGAPYFEHKYSDTLLIFLMKGQLPEVYGERVRLEARVSNIDLTRLPDHLVARIASGEDPMAVLASAAGTVEEALAMLAPGKGGDGG